MTSPLQSEYDIYNLQLGEVGAERIDILYEVDSFVVHGNCLKVENGLYLQEPPIGLELTIGKPFLPDLQDSLVMQNLGYYQLRVPSPGVWFVDIKPGAFRT